MWIYKKGGTELINVLCRIFVKNYKDTKNPEAAWKWVEFLSNICRNCWNYM